MTVENSWTVFVCCLIDLKTKLHTKVGLPLILNGSSLKLNLLGKESRVRRHLISGQVWTVACTDTKSRKRIPNKIYDLMTKTLWCF